MTDDKLGNLEITGDGITLNGATIPGKNIAVDMKIDRYEKHSFSAVTLTLFVDTVNIGELPEHVQVQVESHGE